MINLTPLDVRWITFHHLITQSKGKLMEPIDATPTWTTVLPILVEVAANGTTLEGRDAAWTELRRLAAIADAVIENLKESK